MYSIVRNFRAKNDGATAVEFALVATVLSLMMVGVLDFGLAYSREMQMANAVRAGTQFALARHPDIGPDASSSNALTSIGTIQDQVAAAAPFVTDKANQITITMTCDCEDSSSNPVTGVDCTSSAVLPSSCATIRTQYLNINLAVPYDMTLAWPGFASQLNLSADHTIMIAKN